MNEPLRPDRTEEELAEAIDDMVPTRGYSEVPVAGIGGSAGSAQPLQAVFTRGEARQGARGLAIAQDPAEAQHDGMPRAAIGTNMVDWGCPRARCRPA